MIMTVIKCPGCGTSISISEKKRLNQLPMGLECSCGQRILLFLSVRKILDGEI